MKFSSLETLMSEKMRAVLAAMLLGLVGLGAVGWHVHHFASEAMSRHCLPFLDEVEVPAKEVCSQMGWYQKERCHRAAELIAYRTVQACRASWNPWWSLESL